jgi:hypothetical protein
MSDRTTAVSQEEEQHVFCDKLAVAYHLAVESFTRDLEKIAEMEPDERILGLEAFHESFGRNAVDFVSNLAHAVASTVRAETRIPEIRGTTTVISEPRVVGRSLQGSRWRAIGPSTAIFGACCLSCNKFSSRRLDRWVSRDSSCCSGWCL